MQVDVPSVDRRHIIVKSIITVHQAHEKAREQT